MKNIIKKKSFLLAIEIVNLCQHLQNDQKEYILSKQLMRSGTTIGALVRESEFAESKKDFIHKLSIAQKETNETLYWIELLSATNIITNSQYDFIYPMTSEIMKIITSIIKTAKVNLQTKNKRSI